MAANVLVYARMEPMEIILQTYARIAHQIALLAETLHLLALPVFLLFIYTIANASPHVHKPTIPQKPHL